MSFADVLNPSLISPPLLTAAFLSLSVFSLSKYTPNSIMRPLPNFSSTLAIFFAASSLAAAGRVQILHKRAGEGAGDTDPLLEKRQATPTSDPQQANIRVSVVQPSLCSTSALQYSSAWAVPTGVIDISTETGWGDKGSIWNISADDGVQLVDFKVPCQGSSCTGITGNVQKDGSITQNPDGSWSMNVTDNMQPSVALFGNTAGGNPVDGKYDLTVTSTPPCALPVFQNCSGRRFDPTAKQWAAYSTGDFLTKYLADHNIKSLSDLLAKASTDFLPTTDAQGLICNPDATIYNCPYPSHIQCDSSTKDSTAGFLVVSSVVRMSQMLTLLYKAIDSAHGDIGGYITNIVTKFFQPQATQKWETIVTAVSSVVGLLTFVAILIDGFTSFTSTPALVAAIVGISSALAASSSFSLGFKGQKPDATYLAIDGNYTQSAMDYARGLQSTVDAMWNDTELGPSGIATALASGAWLDVPNPFNVTGIADQARDWLDNLLVTSYINRVFNDADAFIIFVPYAQYKWPGWGTKDDLYDFSQEFCEKNWNNDPGWGYFSTCDIPLGGGGTPGMAVVTRPSSEGGSSKEWTSKVDWKWASYTWNSHDMVASALDGYAEHGFNYNLTNVDFSGILNKGSQDALNTWKRLPLSTPGLFNIPVCIIDDLMDVPGGTQIGRDVSR